MRFTRDLVKQAIRLQQIVEEDGEIYLSGLPVVKGQEVEVIILFSPLTESKKTFTARQLLDSGLIGMWENRMELGEDKKHVN